MTNDYNTAPPDLETDVSTVGRYRKTQKGHHRRLHAKTALDIECNAQKRHNVAARIRIRMLTWEHSYSLDFVLFPARNKAGVLSTMHEFVNGGVG